MLFNCCKLLITEVLIAIVIVLCAMSGCSLIMLAGLTWAILVQSVEWNLS